MLYVSHRLRKGRTHEAEIAFVKIYSERWQARQAMVVNSVAYRQSITFEELLFFKEDSSRSLDGCSPKDPS